MEKLGGGGMGEIYRAAVARVSPPATQITNYEF